MVCRRGRLGVQRVMEKKNKGGKQAARKEVWHEKIGAKSGTAHDT